MRCYGYDETGRHVIEAEAAVIRDVVARVLTGESVRSVVADLRAREVLTSARRPWNQQSLTRLLRNPRLAGLRTYHGEVVGKGTWQPIIDEDTHHKVLTLLDDPQRRLPASNSARKYLLSGGFVVCGVPLADDQVCGKPLYTQPSKSGTRGYVCRSGAPSYGCGRVRIAAPAFEEEVTVRAMARLAAPKVRARLERSIGVARDGQEAVGDALEALTERQEEAAQAYASRDIAMVTLKEIEKQIGLERKQLLEQQAQADRLRDMPAVTPDGLATWWVDAPLERRRELIALVLDRVIVKPATRAGRIGLDLDRLEFVWK